MTYDELRAAHAAGAWIYGIEDDGKLHRIEDPQWTCPADRYVALVPYIAELGQEVGAVADGELSEIVEDMRTCARWYEGTYAANRVAHWANRLACIQSANGLSSLDRYLESGAVQEDASRPLLAARETEDDGAAIMGRLARALAKADPSSKLPHTAIDWLRGQGVHWKSHCPTDPLHDFGEPTSPAHTSEARDAARYAFLRDSVACSLSISHNDHHNMYMSVADTFDSTDGYYNDIGNDERAKMIETDTIWTLHVYPNTPVGFNVYHGSSLDSVCDAAMRQEG